MFRSVSIDNFRPFKRFSVGPLARVNLVAGKNDVGKTALLEAVFLLAAEGNLAVVPLIYRMRGLEQLGGDPETAAEWLWAPLFHQFDVGLAATIKGVDDGGIVGAVQLSVIPSPSARLPVGPSEGAKGNGLGYGWSSRMLRSDYSIGKPPKTRTTQRMSVEAQAFRIEPAPSSLPPRGYFLSGAGRIPHEEVARDYGSLLASGEQYDLEAAMRVVEPRLSRLATLLGPSGTVLYGDVGLGRMLPIALLGEGLARLATMLLKIASARHGYFFVDEIENGLYHGVLRQVWAAIAEAARKFDVQLFATTHSWECIQSAHEAFSASGTYDFRLHRLERTNGAIRAATYDQETLAASLRHELEVR